MQKFLVALLNFELSIHPAMIQMKIIDRLLNRTAKQRKSFGESPSLGLERVEKNSIKIKKDILKPHLNPCGQVHKSNSTSPDRNQCDN